MMVNWRRTGRGAAASVLTYLLLASCGDGSATPPAEPVEAVEVSVRVLATGLQAPWGLAFLPDGTALVTERSTARLLSVTPDGVVTEVQTIPDVVFHGEGGLLGVAVSPDYETDQWVYLYYTTARDNRVARLRLGEAPEPVFTGIASARDGNGGRIKFGPDGMLYITTGDLGYTHDLAQDLTSPIGKILRITPDGQPAPDNPDPTSAVYSYGHRNVQGIAWDQDRRLYASEFGDHRFDELNLIEPGNNYGWPVVEGPGTDPQYTNPIATWKPSDASPSGITVVGDKVYIACLRGERLIQVNVDGSGSTDLLLYEYGRLRDVVPAPDGSLWVLTSNRDGRGAPTDDDDRVLRVELAQV
jgi:glucose/arabinose dehydrogenase